jgi:hypothetical protein
VVRVHRGPQPFVLTDINPHSSTPAGLTSGFFDARLAPMGWPVWAAGVAFLVTATLDCVLISDAIYQIVKERPTFLPFERLLFKRVPATAADSVLQGVSKLLVYVGMLLIQLPLFLILLLSGLRTAGEPQPGSLWDAMGFALLIGAVFALFLAVSSAIVQSKIGFTYLGFRVKAS